MKRIAAAIIAGIVLALALLGNAEQATAVNWHEGPARIVAVDKPDDANWNS